MNSDIVNNIRHVVVLMMENRSFDHLFGDFPGVNGITSGLPNLLFPNLENSPAYPPYPVNVTAQPNPTPNDGLFDPGHGFGAMMTDIFGPSAIGYTHATGPISTTGTYSPPPYGPAVMGGFVNTNNVMDANDNATVMSYFQYLPDGSPGRLNVLHTLAENYVLCDNWFCDTPSMTMPNRNFVHLATNRGYNDFNPQSYVGPGRPEGEEQEYAPNLYDTPTIYKLLDTMLPNTIGSNWAMYGFPGDEYDSAVFSYTSPAFVGDIPLPNFVNANRSIFDFPIDVLTGNLPFYTFIMPSLLFGSIWAAGNSMHPNGDVRLGENLIASLYNVLRNSPIWNDTLLIVTFDENGGIYDHVMPPVNITAPDTYKYFGINGQVFDYTMLGPRIPALLISPWVQKRVICSDQLQNTSILRFVEDLVAAQTDQPASSLTRRDGTAPSFENSDIWTTSARTCCPETIALYGGFPHWGTTLTDPHGDPWGTGPEPHNYAGPYTGPYIPANPPVGLDSTEDPGHFVAEGSAAYQFAKEYCAYYPGHPDSGQPLSRKFRSLRDLRDYMTERRRAARNHYHASKPTKQASL
jgi:phospholipase C